ncbi:tRNA uridine-5-carboxymethylaminomethyl(34) synthesis GTPase MnmE [Candidatus Marinamargulisbacteria bacterium SCGC AG-439-L15]|nr:tRNA uridine-5-carboxymethylaminomethyl(34) synthesis GTPase MnmE [Candidatus Marinamargulisbacteria bacterium SCGC AG-439-L15]
MPKLNHDDTIAAIATPSGMAGIGVIRLSGNNALPLAKELVKANLPWTPRLIELATFIDPLTQSILDEGCVVYFKGPSSFTGEDVIEFHCHGSPSVLKNVLSSILGLGARLAEPGEFSKRAFLNGKLDLTKAESIIDLIHAKGKTAQTVSLMHLKGGLYQKITHLRQQLIHLLEHIDASIDFPDEVEKCDKKEFRAIVDNCYDYVKTVIKHQDYGEWVHSGVTCLIIGYPNVGKSSLLNQLLGKERAIVTSIPGTTRDFIDAQVELGGLIFNFIDTAGIRKTKDEVENLGIEHIETLLEKADAVFWVVDHTRPLNTEEKTIPTHISKVDKKFVVFNKADLEDSKIDKSDPLFQNFTPLSLSAKTGAGIDAFKSTIQETFINTNSDISGDYICNIRQLACLRQVETALTTLKENLEIGLEHDILSIDIKTAILHLGEITGDEVTEEVLDGVFHRFCVGK